MYRIDASERAPDELPSQTTSSPCPHDDPKLQFDAEVNHAEKHTCSVLPLHAAMIDNTGTATSLNSDIVGSCVRDLEDRFWTGGQESGVAIQASKIGQPP